MFLTSKTSDPVPICSCSRTGYQPTATSAIPLKISWKLSVSWHTSTPIKSIVVPKISSVSSFEISSLEVFSKLRSGLKFVYAIWPISNLLYTSFKIIYFPVWILGLKVLAWLLFWVVSFGIISLCLSILVPRTLWLSNDTAFWLQPVLSLVFINVVEVAWTASCLSISSSVRIHLGVSTAFLRTQNPI